MNLSMIMGHVLRVIFCLYQEGFNKEWDCKLNSILDEGELLGLRTHTINYKYQGNNYEIWISNRWYSYAHLHYFNDKYTGRNVQFRPSFRTMVKLHKAVSAIQLLDSQREFKRIYLDGDKS